MILLKNIEVFAPEPLGKRDLLIAGGKIVRISSALKYEPTLNPEVFDGSGMILIPGLIDGHVHIAGAGGEGGPSTRTPELRLSQLIEGGITSVVGCLGTDGFSRTPESVLMKVKSLRAEGVSAWMLTGAYQIPTPTFFGDVGKDILMIEEVIGTGEIALSDHRSSYPSPGELIRLASHTRLGGMLAGKAGVVNIHMGDARDPFRPLILAVEQSELPYHTFLPTHCNRNQYIFEDALEYAMHGPVDLTTSSYPFFSEYEIKPSTALIKLLQASVPPANITMSSDACGSLPLFDEQGNLVSIETGQPVTLWQEVRDAIAEGCDAQFALASVTSNVAGILKLKTKGRITEGADADLVICNESWEIEDVMAMGQWMMREGVILKKGVYEK
ncbi:MAG: beta-aspartyl-peptidase [Bacteroidales bacterium]